MALDIKGVVKPVTNICRTKVYLRSTPKWGKTTLFRDLVLSKYGDAKNGLLIGVGKERGYTMIDNLNVVHVESWNDLVELKRILLERKNPVLKDVKIIAFDTTDELIPIAEEQVCTNWAMKKREVCSSINEAYGGFGKGQEEVGKLIKNYMDDLYMAGFGVWVIGHTKFKTVKDATGEVDGYQALTSNLDGRYEKIFADLFDVILTGTISKSFETKTVNNKDKNYKTDEERRLYFINTLSIEAGGRFAEGAVPEYMVFEGDNKVESFINIFEEGLRKSSSLSDEDYAKYKKEIEQKDEEMAMKNSKDIITLDEYLDYAKKYGENYIKTYYGNENFKNFILNKLESESVKKISDLSPKAKADIIRYGVEDLGCEIVGD